MISIPGRMPILSDTAPTMGSTIRPGITQMAPSEKPIDRARGGMPSDKAAKTPAPTTASVAVMAMLATMVSHSHGARANTAANPPQIPAATARKRMISDGSRVMSLDPNRAPTISPTTCTGSVMAAMYARCTVSRPKACWYSRAASEANPMIEAARKGSE